MNLLYFGTVVAGALYTLIEPQAQTALLRQVGAAFSPTGSLGPVVEAYRTGQLPSAILLTFLVNLFLGSLLALTLTSLVVPFAGLLIGLLRAFIWGVLFSPFGGILPLAVLPHLGVVILEGEAYVVAMTGVWLWWWSTLSAPGGRWQAWLGGLRLQGRVYTAVALLLAVAAAYEALEVIYLVPRLLPPS